MPHWVVYHPPYTFTTEEEKQGLSKSITSYYTRDGVGMPAFYVVVTFVPVPDDSMYVGGVQARSRGKPFVRLQATHIHIRLPNNPDVYRATTKRLDELLKPHIEDKGYDWEYHIDETERLLWKLNGLYAPEFKSADEQVWVKENRAVPKEEMEAARVKHHL